MNFNISNLELPHNSTRSVFNSSEMNSVIQLFNDLHSESTNHEINATYRKCSSILLGGKILGSFNSRSTNTSIIFAELYEEDRPAKIKYFAKVSVVVDGILKIHVLASLQWFNNHPQKNICGKPVTVWESDVFHLCNFLPVHCIKSRSISLVDKLDDTYGDVLFVSPYE